MLTVAYVRVSTDDQVEYSPEAQTKRCRDFARLHRLGSVVVMADEGWSGKNLDRPEMQRLIGLVEAGQVANVIVWRFDRLARDSADFSKLLRLFELHCVELHSVAEGRAELSTASGKMQLGVHGVFAQYYRDHIVENVTRAIEDGVKAGRWLNRAPTGYRMVDGALEPDDMAPVVRRIFALRGDGLSYRDIEDQTGVKYSTVRQIVHNRAYLGEVKHRTDWYPGVHEPLVTPAQFEAAHRGQIPGRRRSRDLLSGRVRCGECKRVLGVEYNDRSQAIYRCKHRGRGCDLPGRSARGLHRAAVLGLGLLGQDEELRAAIRAELSRHLDPAPVEDSSQAVASLKRKRQRLLDLYYEDKITPDTFEEEERRLTAQINTLEAACAEHEEEAQTRSDLAERFEEVAQLLATVDIDTVWHEADERERRVLVEDLVDAVYVFADHLQVVAFGAPPLRVTLDEVGLRSAGMRPLVSEGRREPLVAPATGGETGTARRSPMPAVTPDIDPLPRLAPPPAEANPRGVRSVTTAPKGFEGEGFPVRRAFAGIDLALLDPFVHLDQIGEVDYAPGEPKGTPWHPHRGFETATYMMDGVLQHADSTGGGGIISNGGTQWMTAGKGILHIETPPHEVVAAGGWFHGLQLWVNLPKAKKWVEPRYQDLEGDAVTFIASHDGGALLRIIAGDVDGHRGPGSTHTPMNMVHATLQPGARLVAPWPTDYNALVYILGGKGAVGVERRPVETGQMSVHRAGDSVVVEADVQQDGRSAALEVLLLGGRPIGEPVAWYGPFVMNTEDEIQQAFDDFRAGRLGQVPVNHRLSPTDRLAAETDSSLD